MNNFHVYDRVEYIKHTMTDGDYGREGTVVEVSPEWIKVRFDGATHPVAFNRDHADKLIRVLESSTDHDMHGMWCGTYRKSMFEAIEATVRQRKRAEKAEAELGELKKALRTLGG